MESKQRMNVFANDLWLKTQRQRTFFIQVGGMAMVILSFILSFLYAQYPLLILIAYPALLVGFPMWHWSRGATRRWAVATKTEEQVSAEFKGLNNKYTLFHNVVLDKIVLDHVLLSPDGILVLEMKEGGGLVTCRSTDAGDVWRIKLGMLERIARVGEESLRNPTLELDGKIAALQTWLAGKQIGRGPLPITGVVVFREPRTPLTIESSKYDVLRLPELKDFVLAGPADARRVVLLPTDERNRIAAALRGLLPTVVEKPAAPKRPESDATRPVPTPPAKRPDPSATRPIKR